VFSSKEAIFKAIYPLERVWLEFSDAELIWNDQSHRFRARLLRQGGGGLPAGASLDVHCRVWENYVFSAVALESDLP
jgi:4'-phosphopantetheinyl transferase EntD